jgi:hypothetical protein
MLMRITTTIAAAITILLSASFASGSEPPTEETTEEATEELSADTAVPMVIPDFGQAQPKAPETPHGWTPPARHRWVWWDLTALRVNPVGLTTRLNTGYRLQLWERPGVVFEQSHFALKFAGEISPAIGKLGGRIELQPLAVLRLHAEYQFMRTFGTFQQLSSFSKADVDYSDQALKDLHKVPATRAYATSGETLELGALLQIKLGSVAVRNDFKAHRHRMDLRPGDRFLYNRSLDVLFPNSGWAVTDDVDLIYLTNFGLKLGARYTYSDVIYAETDDAGGSMPTHRVGPAILYSFAQQPPGVLYQGPTLLLLSQWWVKHRYRTGQKVSAALPYLVVGIIQKGDFL